MPCPPLLELSQFLDAELDAGTMQQMEQHLQHCQSCAGHLQRLEGFSIDRAWDSAGQAAASCPSPERLLALLNAAAPDPATDLHLRECDPCAHLLQRFQRAMAMTTEMPVAVPASLQQRAIAWAQPQAAVSRRRAQPSWWQRLRAGLRYPVLMPAAFATGMLLYVLALQVPLLPGVPAGSRSAARPAVTTRRVITSEARVFAEASARAQLIERLARGSVVEISFEERGWYRVTLADGRQGWIEQHALQ